MRRPGQLEKVLLSLLGLLLMAFMTLEVAHSHPTDASGPGAATHCQICAVAHVAITKQPAWLTGYVLNLIGTIRIGEPRCGTRPVVRTAFIRPPPASDSSLA